MPVLSYTLRNLSTDMKTFAFAFLALCAPFTVSAQSFTWISTTDNARWVSQGTFSLQPRWHLRTGKDRSFWLSLIQIKPTNLQVRIGD
jgi:hypothetical protein